MSKPKLSQTVLYEILVKEIESLKKTKNDYKRVNNQITDHLQRLEALYQQPICVDIEGMKREHENIKTTLQSSLSIPNWLVIVLLCLTVGLGLSVVFNYKQYAKNRYQRAYIEHAEAYIEELEAKSKKRR